MHNPDIVEQIDGLGTHIALQLERVKTRIKDQRAQAVLPSTPHNEPKRLEEAEPERWIAIARTKYQEAQMALRRAATQPGLTF